MKIEKNVPMPPERKRMTSRKPHYLFPFHEMDVGDSFEVPAAWLLNCRASAYRYGESDGKQFTVRSDTTSTFRCWRIK